MKITSQEEYGLRCLLRLARSPARSSLTIPEIATAEGMSGPYVAKLLSLLRQAGLVESVRGRSGGYTLARPADEISVGALMGAMGEPLFDEPEYCERHAGSEANGICVHHDDCTLRTLWETLDGWVKRSLNQITLADLLQSREQISELLRTRLADAATEPLITLTTMKH